MHPGMIAVIVVIALLSFWMGIRLVEAMVPLMGQAVQGFLFTFVSWALTFAGMILTVVLVMAMLLIVGAAVIWALLGIADLIIRRIGRVREDIRKLGTALSIRAREAAIDGAFLCAIGLASALALYMGTADFLDAFGVGREFSQTHSKAIHVLAGAAVACCFSKVLLLIPVRSVKIIAILAMLVVLGGAASMLINLYGARRFGFLDAVDSIRESPLITFVMILSVLVLLLALFHPFSPGGWRRVLTIEQPESLPSESAAPSGSAART
jgi:hypothetical protein